MTFAQLLNQNSFIVAALVVFAIMSLVLWRVRRTQLRLAVLFIAALVLIAANVIFRVGASEMQTTTQFDEILGTHQPVVLEIYSNY